MAVVLALASAVVYGAADFCGGLASRRASAFAVVALSQAAGLLPLLALLPWLGGDPTGGDMAWGASAGVAGAGGLLLFYAALAGGVMSVVAPVTAVTAATVPVLVGLAGGETIGAWAALGIGLALVGILLVSAEGGLGSLRSARPGNLAPALLAGAFFGTFFVLLDRTSADAGLTPLAGARLMSVALVVVLAVLGGHALSASRAAMLPVLLAGAGDMAANALFLLATQQGGQLAVVGVLASLYPASTVVLAQVLLRERLAATQGLGLGTVVVAVVLISLPG